MRTFRIVVAGLTLAVCAAASQASGPQASPDTDRAIREGLNLSGYSLQDLAVPGAPGTGFTVAVRIGAEVREVAFEPHSVRAPGFRVVAQDESGALNEIPAPPETTYRGTIAGLEGAVVSGSLTDAGLTAVMRLPGDMGTWGIQPLSQAVPGAPRATHLVYRDADGVPGDWGCGVNDVGLPLPVLKQLAGGSGPGGPDGMLVCQLACDADFQYYQSWGSNSNSVTNDITAIVNAVSNIYEVDCQIEFVITQIIIRTSAGANPYTSNAPGTLLGQFQSYWLANHGSVQRDLAHLFTGRNLDGSVIGIAYLNGICNTNAFGLSQSRYTTNFAFRTALTAHETGHNFSAQHCNTICSPCEIMCSGIGGCSGIVNSFSTCDIASITSYAATRPCLQPPPPPPPVLALPFFDDFAPALLDPIKWPVNTGGIVTTAASNERSEPNSLSLLWDGTVESAHMNTSAWGQPVFVSLWTEHVGVELGKELRVRFFNSAQQFQVLLTLVSDGVDQSRFVFHEVALPASGFSATESRIRIEAVGTQPDDTWYVDDVGVSPYCRTDINKDRALTIADFGAFQAAFVGGNLMVADFNDDGALSIADFVTYQSKFVQGCY